MALEWRTIFVPLASGVNTGADPRALEAPSLAVCKDAMFDEIGGAQTRFPYTAKSSSILGGGTLADIRRLATNGGELLAFTKDSLYSWSERDSKWVLKGTHLAVKTTEKSAFVDTNEQILSDRCEVGGCVLFTWVNKAAAAANYKVMVAALDKTTGAVLLAPTQPTNGGINAITRPRLVALASKALLFFIDQNDDLRVIDIDPSALSTDVVSASTSVAVNVAKYDACPTSAGTSAMVAAAYITTTDYEVAIISSAAAVTATATKTGDVDGPIAIADSAGARLLVARANGTSIRGDLINNSTLADTSVNNVLGAATGATIVNQITACYRSVQVGGEWTCYVFWGADETDTSGATLLVETNTINNSAGIGTEASFRGRLGIASRAFDHDGRVYLWLAFAGSSFTTNSTAQTQRAALQNTYFLYRDDAFLVAKAATNRGSGFSQAAGSLPGVQSLGSGEFAWCGGERRIINIGVAQSSYSDRGPREILFEFDSDEARRTARLGRTLYITGGEILQYDGVRLVECGFHIFPWVFDVAQVLAAGTNVDVGTHVYKGTLEWLNAVGEADGSTTASSASQTWGAAGEARITFAHINVTHKTTNPPAIRMWRTPANPTAESPFYLITSEDPAAGTGDNGYFPNDDTGNTVDIDDNMSDATAQTKRAFEENGDILERLAPPPASIIAATQDRLFLAGIADNPYQIVYSRLRGSGEVATFHDALSVEVPPSGGAVTGLAFLNETLIAFCEHATWALPNDGFSNVGSGQNYGPARLLSGDIGAVSHDSIALTPRGLVFESQKGIYLLGQGWDFQFIGKKVDFWTDGVSSAHVMETEHQVRFLSNAGWTLVWDYLVNEWSEWTVNGLSATVWQGAYHYNTSTAVSGEAAGYGTAVTYAMDLETAWIPVGPGGKLGRGKVLWVQILGEAVSAHDLRIQVGRDYLSDSSGATLFQTKYWPATPIAAGGRLQVQHAPSIRWMESIKLRIKAFASGSTTNPPTGGALKVTGFALHIGMEPGIWRSLAAAQRQ